MKAGDIVRVMEHLEKDPAFYVNAKDTLGLSALHLAALKGDVFLLECLLCHDSVYNKKDIVRRT